MINWGWILSRIKYIISLNVKHLFIISFLFWGLLLIPDRLAVIAGIYEFRNEYKQTIGFIAIIAVLSLFAVLIIHVVNKIQINIKKRGALKQLSPIEKYYLAHYIDNNTTTKQFNYSDGVAMGLRKKGILHLTSQMSRFGTYFDFNINQEIFKYLSKNKHILEDGRNYGKKYPHPDRYLF